ncbi:MAG: hypothetical protein LBE80_00565, partial [Deltaproteobacteria bacterium]|nr:hypothetical protein [Deltaproteobacteria bacterium]
GGHNIKLAEARLNNLWAEYPYLYVKPKNEKLSTGPVTKNDFVSSKDGPPISPPSWPDDFENQKKTIVSGERLLYLKALPLDQITMPIRRTGTFRVPNYDKTHLYFQKALREKFDPIVGMNYLKGAAEAGLASAGTLFGNYLLHCQDERLKGISFLEKSVEKDDPEALIAYGALYWEGLFYKRDYAKAIPYFQRAADQGDVEAYVVLIVLERQVYGGPKDKEKAEQFISDLSQLGWPIGNKMKKLLKRKTKFTERRSRNMKATIRYDYD